MSNILILIGITINIRLTTAQLLAYPQDLTLQSCYFYYDVGDQVNVGPYTAQCLSGNPCGCDHVPFSYTLLEEMNLNDFFQLSDNSWIDFTVKLGPPGTYYKLNYLRIGWHNISKPADDTKTFLSILDVNMNDWVNVTYFQSNDGMNDISRISASDLAPYLFDDIRVHIEWNTPTPDGLIYPAYFTASGAVDTKNPTQAPISTKQPSKQPTKQPTYNPTQIPTASPTSNGLVQVSLNGLNCCDPKGNNNSYYWYKTYNKTGMNVSVSVPCCYGDGIKGITVSGNVTAGIQNTYYCDSLRASYAVYPNGPFYPDLETFCGIDQFRSNYSIPEPVNISVSSFVWVDGDTNTGINYHWDCYMRYSGFIWNEGEFRCNNDIYNYCPSPVGIIGYVNHLSVVDSMDNNYCRCNHEYEYLEWTIIGVDGYINVDQQFWNDISWNNDYLNTQSVNDSCFQVKVKHCNDNKQCIFMESSQSVDTAMSYFQSGDYLSSLSTNCYCYQMYNKCITTTIEPTTSEPSTDNPTTAVPTSTHQSSTVTSNTDKTTKEVDDKSDAFKVEVALSCSTLILILKYLLN